MQKIVLALGVALPASLPLTLHAASLPDITASLSGGTLGVGPEINLRYPEDSFGLRLGASFLDFKLSGVSDQTTYTANARLRSGGATFDYYPFQNGFRLSLGARINGNQADVTATPNATVTLNGRTYKTAGVGTLAGIAKYNEIAPYLGVGYSFPVYSQIVMSVDGGVLYQGSGRLGLFPTGTITNAATFQADLAAQSSRIKRDLRYAEFFPVLMISIGWRF